MLLAALLCSGCAVTPNASREDYRAIFTKVIQKSFDESKANNVCLPSLFGAGESAPDFVDVALESDGRPSGTALRLAQLTALETVGLVARTDSERTVGTRISKIASFKRTAAGATFFAGGTFCYARVELEGIVKWKGPVVLGDYRAAWVYYTTKLTKVADWASAPAVLAAYPSLAAVVKNDPPKVRQVAIDYSSEGWDVAEYSKLIQLQ